MQTEISAKMGCSDLECRSIEEFTSVSLLRTKTIQKPPFKMEMEPEALKKKKDKNKGFKRPRKDQNTKRQVLFSSVLSQGYAKAAFGDCRR